MRIGHWRRSWCSNWRQWLFSFHNQREKADCGVYLRLFGFDFEWAIKDEIDWHKHP